MIELFDVQAGFGGPGKGERSIPTAEELLGEMGRLSVARALVHVESDDTARSAPLANHVLYQACGEHDRLVPCPTLIPSGGRDVPPEEEQVAELIDRNGSAAYLNPKHDSWSTAEWCSGKLFSALQERRIPVLLRHAAVSFDTVAELAGHYTELSIILFQIGFGQQRMLVPLMERFPNVYVSIGCPYSMHRVVENLVAWVGADRLLFGTGFPTSDMMPPITMLTYAGISDADKQLIGSENLKRLIGGIAR